MIRVLNNIHTIIWGLPALSMILGVGVYLSIKTGFVQLKLFPQAMRLFCNSIRRDANSTGSMSSHQALCTALAATVGTGNIAGVAGAIAIGGPGAVFWMWISAFLGMATKFAEASLGVRYRQRNTRGETVAGPMYMLLHGVGPKYHWLAALYCILSVVAAFGVGNATQVNAVLTSLNGVAGSNPERGPIVRNLVIGSVMAIIVAAVLFGGMKRIGRISEALVPVAALFYMLLCLGVIAMRLDAVGNAFVSIFRGAFAPSAVTGGAIGSCFQALSIGASRGVFSNEAGLGTAAIAHGSSDVAHPIEQGLMGVVEVFIDTVIICTLTALVILCSGVKIPYGSVTAAELTTAAFSTVYGDWVCVPITVALCLFAIATILGWSLYGMRSMQFLLGEKSWFLFALLQVLVILSASIGKTETIWLFSETVNGLMIIPSLMILITLSNELVALTKHYIECYGS